MHVFKLHAPLQATTFVPQLGCDVPEFSRCGLNSLSPPTSAVDLVRPLNCPYHSCWLSCSPRCDLFNTCWILGQTSADKLVWACLPEIPPCRTPLSSAHTPNPGAHAPSLHGVYATVTSFEQKIETPCASKVSLFSSPGVKGGRVCFAAAAAAAADS